MITVEINDRTIRQAFAALESALTDMSPAMDEIGLSLVASSKERIGQGTSPDGSPFAPRSPATLDRYGKGRDGKGQGPLWHAGIMRGQIAHAFGPTFVEVISPSDQSAVMQFGAAQGAFGLYEGLDKLGRRMPTASRGATSRLARSSASRIKTGRTSPRSSANGWRTRSTAPDNRPSGHLATPDDR